MCMICLEWEKERMTSAEAFRAIGEVMHGKLDFKEQRHLEELSDRIMDKEVPFQAEDAETYKNWLYETDQDKE